MAVLLIKRLTEDYPGILTARYDIEETGTPVEVLEAIGSKRGCLKKGGVIDYDRASRILLDEFRSGTLGRITLEKAD